MNAGHVIEVRQVSFSYTGLPVLDHVDLNVQRGEFLGIVGPNGGGKTTLLKLILGLLTPTSGSIRVAGRSPSSPGRLAMGYVPQFASFPRGFPISVIEVALLGRLGRTRLLGGYRAEDRRAARQALRETEIAALSERPISSLSGGQLQRVLIARALACEPEILLLDEPTANIDHRVEKDIFDLLRQLNARMTIVVVSHDIGFISQYVSHVACLNRTLVCHETSALTGKMIEELYASPVRMIQHEHEGAPPRSHRGSR